MHRINARAKRTDIFFQSQDKSPKDGTPCVSSSTRRPLINSDQSASVLMQVCGCLGGGRRHYITRSSQHNLFCSFSRGYSLCPPQVTAKQL